MTDDQSNDPPVIKRHPNQVGALLVMGLSLLLLGFLTLCYAKQYDACAAITVYPSWVWFVCGFILALILLKLSRKKTGFFTLSLWGLFFVVYADTPLSLIRGIGRQPATDRINAGEETTGIRVISLNCSGNSKSMLALKKWKPGLILIQESPGTEKLKEVAKELYGAKGEILAGIDASILVRGQVERIHATGDYVIGRVTPHSGLEFIVVSLRLTTPPFRFDLWNPDCWRAFRDHRIKQRAEVVALAKVLQELPADMPVIVGGDFNARPRDAIFAELPAWLRDTFSSAGCGWGNTITNKAPFLRIDQIWTTDFFQPNRVYSETAVDTDHRAVIADLSFK